jgi:hypothetical protein
VGLGNVNALMHIGEFIKPYTFLGLDMGSKWENSELSFWLVSRFSISRKVRLKHRWKWPA